MNLWSFNTVWWHTLVTSRCDSTCQTVGSNLYSLPRLVPGIHFSCQIFFSFVLFYVVFFTVLICIRILPLLVNLLGTIAYEFVSLCIILMLHKCIGISHRFFLAHLAKGNVSFCHYLGSVVR